MSFEDLGLEPTLLKAIAEAGYTTPTPIQLAAIPEALRGRDVLGIAQTGTGKTAAFTLPIIHRLARGRARARMPRTLVLEPTRELAAQVADNFEKYGKHHKLTMALLIGGVSFADQDAKLTRGVDVLIATPGRLLDHFERGRLLLTGIEAMVVDEADRMLDMGFIPDIERIFKLTPATRQTLFFSATMPPEIQRLTDQFLREPVRIEVSRPATAATTITQKILRLSNDAANVKRAGLRKLLDYAGVRNGIIFCNRKTTVDVVAKSLQKHGYNARPIHGDLAQAYRTETLDKFRSGETKFLVASDVAARGLDIPDVSHVFNYDVPIHADDYVHRIGRTGRAGREGATFMLVTPSDDKAYGAILRMLRVEAIEELDIAVDIEPRRDERRGRDGDRSRGRRGETRGRGRGGEDRPRRERRPRESERAPREPAPAAAAESAPPPARAQAETAPSERRRERPERERSETRERSQEPRERGRGRGEQQKAEPVVGLGEHTPAFLLR